MHILLALFYDCPRLRSSIFCHYAVQHLVYSTGIHTPVALFQFVQQLNGNRCSCIGRVCSERTANNIQ